MTDEDVKLFVESYRKALMKGMDAETWEEALAKMSRLGVDTSDERLHKTYDDKK